MLKIEHKICVFDQNVRWCEKKVVTLPPISNQLDIFMKKLLTFFAAIATTISLYAEGYQVNSLSTKQNGMGHTGTALKLGAESMIFNPAGMGFLDKKLDVNASFTAIFSSGEATTPDGKVYKTDSPASTPINFNLGFSIYDNLKAGVSFYTPYGSNINWTDNWGGALLNQKVKLTTYTVQPTAAWRILPNLSVGAGLMVTWGTVDLNKGLISPTSLDMVLQSQGMPAMFGDVVPASVNLKGTANVTLGYNVGVLYDVNDKISIGANYRSKMMMTVDAGDANVSYANDIAKGILENQVGLIDKAQFTAEMPCVSILNFGVSYKPISSLTLAADVQYSFWSQYENLDINFLSSHLAAFNQHIVKNYKNSFRYHLGAQYALTNRFDLRAGVMIDTAPMRDDNYNPETPGMTKIEPSVGFSFRPLKGFSIDVAMLYVAGMGRDNAKCSYEDLLMKAAQMPYVKTFEANYKIHAFCPSIGASFWF